MARPGGRGNRPPAPASLPPYLCDADDVGGAGDVERNAGHEDDVIAGPAELLATRGLDRNLDRPVEIGNDLGLQAMRTPKEVQPLCNSREGGENICRNPQPLPGHRRAATFPDRGQQPDFRLPQQSPESLHRNVTATHFTILQPALRETALMPAENRRLNRCPVLGQPPQIGDSYRIPECRLLPFCRNRWGRSYRVA